MRISINRDHILPALLKIVGVVERRQTLPILSNVLLRLYDKELTIIATDLEIEVKTHIRTESVGESEFTLPARKFLDICKSLPEGSVIEIKVQEDKKVRLLSGKSKFILGTLSSEDYPIIEISSPKYKFNLKESTLKDLLSKVSFSMAQQDVRYYLNGMLIELTTNTIKGVATDGHRLAVCEKEIGMEIEPFCFLLPRKAVVEIDRLLEKNNKSIDVEVFSNFAKFTVGDTELSTKLIDGKYPDYERVVPRSCDKRAVIESDIFKDALVRASILSSEKYKGIRVSLEENLLRIQAHNPEQEEAEEEIEIDYKYEFITIGFNVGYLLDILTSLQSKKILLEFSDTNSSSIIRPYEEKDVLYVVMPMRL